MKTQATSKDIHNRSIDADSHTPSRPFFFLPGDAVSAETFRSISSLSLEAFNSVSATDQTLDQVKHFSSHNPPTP